MGSIIILLILSSFFFGIFFISRYSYEQETVKKEQELGFVISSLKDGEVFSVSSATHMYLVERLREQATRSQGDVVELGLLTYYVREISSGYILFCSCEPVNDGYYLEVIQKSIKINPVGQYIDMLLIKKVYGPYYKE